MRHYSNFYQSEYLSQVQRNPGSSASAASPAVKKSSAQCSLRLSEPALSECLLVLLDLLMIVHDLEIYKNVVPLSDHVDEAVSRFDTDI